MQRNHSAIIAKGLLFATLGILLKFSADGGIFDTQTLFVLTTSLLLIYLAGEIFRVRQYEPARWIINPAVLCSLFTFIMGFGITNVIYFLPQSTLNKFGLYAVVTPAMNTLMVLVLLGAIAMWLAYWSPIAGALARRVRQWLNTTKWIKRSLVPKKGALFGCLLISFAGRMLQIRFGVYGYSSDLDMLHSAAAYMQYLGLAEKLAIVALMLAALQYYSGHGNPFQSRLLLIVILVYEVLFGFLSGFKSQVVMPFLVVAICQYWCVKKIPWKVIALVPVAIVFAYGVIEPFRYARYHDERFDSRSFAAIAETVYDAAFDDGERRARSYLSDYLAFIARMNMTYIGSLGIDYAQRGPLPENSPKFLEDIVYSPLHAFIPRAIWQSKSKANHGLWYTQVVMGRDNITSSTGMGPFTYLYFTGGAFAVLIGFGVVGLLHRVFNEFLTRKVSGGEAIVFLLFLPTIIFVDSVFNSIFVNFFRMVPIFVVLQYLIISVDVSEKRQAGV